MFARTTMPTELSRLLEAQHGAISAAQARGLGLAREPFRRFSRDWHRLGHGLYVAGEVSWSAFAWASVLRGGDRSCLGGAAACFAHGLIRRPPGLITVWADKPTPPLVFGDYRARFRRGVRLHRGDPPKVRLEEAVLDYASEATSLDLVEAVTRALAERRTTPSRLRAEMQDRGRVAQRRLLTELTEHSNQGIQSVLEWLFETNVMRPHQLPGSNRQVRLTRSNRVDVYFMDHGVIVELDGRGFHDANRDARRDNEHALVAGAVTLRFTWEQVMHEPCFVARTVERALRIRGWDGAIRTCRDCRMIP